MENKVFRAFTLKADADQGMVEHLVAVFGNIDEGGDIIHKGAFAKTIQERSGKIRCLDQHQTDSIMRVLGKPINLREMGRDELPPQVLSDYPEATGALWVQTQYLMNTPEGKGAFERVKAGAVDEYSIGYDPLDVDYSKVTHDGKEMTVRNLRQCRLWEYSPVIFAMNPATATLSAKEKQVKAITDADKSKIVSQLRDLPMKDLVATHRRMHMWAVQGNILTNFTKADMNWLHAACERELRRRAEDEEREPSEESPLEWGKGGEGETDEKWLPSAIGDIIEREEDASPHQPKPKSGRKIGRIFATRNVNRLRELSKLLNEMLDEIGEKWGDECEEDEDEEDEGKAADCRAVQKDTLSKEQKQAGPDNSADCRNPPTLPMEDQLKLIDIELLQLE